MIKGGVQIIRMEIYDVFFFHEGEGGFEFHIPILKNDFFLKTIINRSSWLNCALRDNEAVYWFSIGHYEAVAVGN